jgi:polyhydroxyalkanoate synthesis regulator phasin
MLKRFIPVAGAFTLMLALLAGCQDSLTTGPQSTSSVTGSEDPYTAYLAPEEALNDAADAPSFDEVMNDPSFLTPVPGDPGRGGPGRDSTRKDTTRRDTTHRKDTVGHGGRDTVRKRPQDSVRRNDRGPKDPGPGRGNDSRLRPVNYGQIISQLRLTPAQDSAIRICFRELNECTRSAAARYRNALQDLRDALQTDLREIRAAVESGRITREEARALVADLIAQYRRQAAALEAAYREAIENCRREFERCVASHLTPEQLRRWQAMIRR